MLYVSGQQTALPKTHHGQCNSSTSGLLTVHFWLTSRFPLIYTANKERYVAKYRQFIPVLPSRCFLTLDFALMDCLFCILNIFPLFCLGFDIGFTPFFVIKLLLTTYVLYSITQLNHYRQLGRPGI